MTDQPLVSIVTPSYNQVEYLERTIQSVLGQNYSNIEYIIIDGGSDDGSRAIIERFEDQLAYWVSEPDQGQTEAINKGFAKASGEYLAWLNADDVYKPEAVGEAVAYLEAHLDVGMVYGEAEFIDAEGRVIGMFRSRQTDYQRLMRGQVYIPQQAAFWRSSLWRQVGPLDPNFYFAMDYDLWVRLAKVSRLKYHPRVWAQFRLHSDSKTIQDDIRCWPEMLQVHRREGGHWFSLITLRYWLRRLLGPLVTYRRQKMAQGRQE